MEAALGDADVQSSSSVRAKELDMKTPVYRLQSADETPETLGDSLVDEAKR